MGRSIWAKRARGQTSVVRLSRLWRELRQAPYPLGVNEVELGRGQAFDRFSFYGRFDLVPDLSTALSVPVSYSACGAKRSGYGVFADANPASRLLAPYTDELNGIPVTVS